MSEPSPGGAAPELRIRLYRPADLAALHRLDQIRFEPPVSYSYEELESYIVQTEARTWVAEGARGPAGIAGFVVAHCDHRLRGHIITLDVAPEWRRRSVGGKLMDAAEQWIGGRGGKTVFLETAEDNLNAQAFYRERGYIALKRIEHYYGDDAAWLMLKSLRTGRRENPATSK